MDFASWSPSHTILVLVVIIGFIGQVAVLFYRTSRLEKRAEKTDRRVDDVINTMNQGFSDIRSEMNHRFSDVQSEIRDVRKEISDVRSELNQQIGEVRTEIVGVRDEISKLNQNHIDHLTHHRDS